MYTIVENRPDGERDLQEVAESGPTLRPFRRLRVRIDLADCGDSGDVTLPKPKLRTRLRLAMQPGVISDGIWGNAINTQIIRSVGETARYTRGAPLDVIQRWGRGCPCQSTLTCGMTHPH